MRIWDLETKFLCNQHLLGEHRELHAIWSILTKNKKGYSKHPETLRWRGKLKALFNRHKAEVKEMKNRGFKHFSDLNFKLASGSSIQKNFLNSAEEQKKILKNKFCRCLLQ